MRLLVLHADYCVSCLSCYNVVCFAVWRVLCLAFKCLF